MDWINYHFLSKQEIRDKLPEIYDATFHKKLIRTDRLTELFDGIIDTAWFILEFPYVDKVYRDSYYTYYASKLRDYGRNSIRISVFKDPVEEADFLNSSGFQKEKYLGFFTLRPVPYSPIGRSAFNKKAFKQKNFVICSTQIPASCIGKKVSVTGFPSASQNTETISCAETTLWAIMEYFSYRYAEYRPLLPSKILNILEQLSIERQIPSKGLNLSQLSFALKKIGFGTMIYSRKQYQDSFDQIIHTYIESGIPILLTLQNSTIGHAVLAIGRESIDLENIKTPLSKNKLDDFHSIDRKIVLVDDNFSPYKLTSLQDPTAYYGPKSSFSGCEVSNVIIPLYHKIYLDAVEAKGYGKAFIEDQLDTQSIDMNNLLHRCYLMSSRSFKHAFLESENNQSDMKRLIARTPMPKFIWVNEVLNLTKAHPENVDHLVLLDATEPNQGQNGRLLLSIIANIITTIKNGDIQQYKLNSQPGPFELITHNLSGF